MVTLKTLKSFPLTTWIRSAVCFRCSSTRPRPENTTCTEPVSAAGKAGVMLSDVTDPKNPGIYQAYRAYRPEGVSDNNDSEDPGCRRVTYRSDVVRERAEHPCR